MRKPLGGNWGFERVSGSRRGFSGVCRPESHPKTTGLDPNPGAPSPSRRSACPVRPLSPSRALNPNAGEPSPAVPRLLSRTAGPEHSETLEEGPGKKRKPARAVGRAGWLRVAGPAIFCGATRFWWVFKGSQEEQHRLGVSFFVGVPFLDGFRRKPQGKPAILRVPEKRRAQTFPRFLVGSHMRFGVDLSYRAMEDSCPPTIWQGIPHEHSQRYTDSIRFFWEIDGQEPDF